MSPIAHDARPQEARDATRRKTPTPAPVPRTPGPHLVNFYALDGSADLTVRMGDGPATLTGGDGGWVEEPRRGFAPAVWWDAPSSYRQSIPLMFEGDGASVEQAINVLYRLARTSGSRVPPPVLMIAGPAIHRADLQWVMEPLEPGTRVVRRADDGDRTRQDFTVRLLAYNGVDVIVERSPSRKAAGETTTKAGQGRRTYRVTAADTTLAKIAARKDIYGDASQWKRIAVANKIRDPRTLKVGQVLKIPRG